MNDPKQRTLAQSVTLAGAGVHTGEATSVTLRPAEPGTGLRFRRSDLPGAPEIPASLDHVVATDLGTALGTADVRVLTVEHALAALAAQGVDNALLDVTGPELPIRDGSFQDYVTAIADAGAVEQPEPAAVIAITEPITMRGEGGTSYVATPSDTFR